MRLLITIFTLTLTAGFSINESFAQRRPTSPSPNPNVAALDKEVRNLRVRVWGLESKAFQEAYAELDTSQDTYVPVKSNTATFLIRFVKADPYLNGYKVTLAIGNMTSASFNGFSLTLKWGTKEPAVSDKWLAWLESLKSKQQEFTDDFLPGKWNRVEVVLLPATADELGYLRVSITTSVIGLR